MDIYEFAMQMEQDGERFYRDLASQNSSPGISRILNLLADDEVRHYQVVRDMAAHASPELTETTILTDAKNVFVEMRGTALDLEGMQVDLYRQAQEIERRSQAFYTESATQVAKPAAKALLLKIADEEQRHYFLLDQIIEFLDQPRIWMENAEFTHLDEY